MTKDQYFSAINEAQNSLDFEVFGSEGLQHFADLYELAEKNQDGDLTAENLLQAMVLDL